MASEVRYHYFYVFGCDDLRRLEEVGCCFVRGSNLAQTLITGTFGDYYSWEDPRFGEIDTEDTFGTES